MLRQATSQVWVAAMHLAVVATLCVCLPSAAIAVTIDLVPVGDAGNIGITGTLPGGLGTVSNLYQIGKYDVTIGQYCAFLNAVAKVDSHGLYNPSMYADLNVAGIYRSGSSGSYSYNVIGPYGATQVQQATAANRPITYVSWFDAARFVNWLANGQPVGLQADTTTEQGVYSLSGAISGSAPVRSNDAPFFMPSQSEWFKAAYYSPILNSGSGGYWTFPTKAHQSPGNNLGPLGANHVSGGVYAVTRSNRELVDQNYLTDVGAFPAAESYYGTFDQSGNVYQWTDGPGKVLTLRGGSWRDDNAAAISNQSKFVESTAFESAIAGFRIAASIGPRSFAADLAPTAVVIPIPQGLAFTQGQSGHLELSGSLPVFKVEAGQLTLDRANMLTGSMTVQAGIVSLANSGALAASTLAVVAGGTVQVAPYLVAGVGGLNLSGTGLLDLTNGGLTTAAGLSPTELVAQLVAGRNGGTWDGTSGITSSVTAAQVANSELRAVGWLDNGDGSLTTAYAAQGDTNLDWVVDILDVANFVGSGKYGTPDAATWSEGDFNYDGVVDIQDVADFAASGLYGEESYNVSSDTEIAAVPEPSALSCTVMAIVISIAHRRRFAGSNTMT